MTLKQADFFREATLRVCGSLNIETVMCQSVLFLSQFMPADQLILTYYDQKLNGIRSIARASAQACRTDDPLIQMPPEFDLGERIKGLPRTHICHDTEKEPINHRLATVYGLKGYSLLQMFLETRERKFGLGHLTLCAKGKNRYSREDLDLFTLIKEPFTMASANVLQHRKLLELNQTLEDDNRYFRRELQDLAGHAIIGGEGGLKNVMGLVSQVSSKTSPVLLSGETGVGKDIIANAIHALSRRSNAPFIKVNCGAIPDTLIDTELFGHEKGAFTGAVRKKRGRFERANHGTIFLDEIGELPLQAQVRLLRVLQNKEIERIGGTELIELDIRVIAATNKNLEKHLNQTFREDLWYRLNVFPISIPPLRQRRMDIIPLANHLIKKKSMELQLNLSPKLSIATIDRLMEYRWPGNVRELENLIERALIINEGEVLEIDPFSHTKETPSPVTQKPPQDSLRLDDVVTGHIEKVLNMTDGKIHGPGGAAEILDVNAGTLRNRMKKLSIPFGRKRKHWSA